MSGDGRIPISGRTRIFGVVADPIAHVRACDVFNPLFANAGIDAVLVPLHVPMGRLGGALEGARALANLGGVLVTIPHKEAVLDLVDDVGPQAALVGAANVIRRTEEGRLACENFDGLGFVAGLVRAGHDVAGQRVLVIGAGGAGKAIAFALADAAVGELVIANRSEARAVALAARVRAAYPEIDARAGPLDPRGHDLVVNATALGLAPSDPLPFAIDRLAPATLVCDIIMKPERTALIEAAAKRGHRVHLGRHMFDAQVPLLAAFLGVESDRI